MGPHPFSAFGSLAVAKVFSRQRQVKQNLLDPPGSYRNFVFRKIDTYSQIQRGEAKFALALEVGQTYDHCPEHCESVLLIMVAILNNKLLIIELFCI